MHYSDYFNLRFTFLTLSLMLPLQSYAGAIGPPPEVNLAGPAVMVSFGDSITAGAFASTSANLPLSFLPSIFNLGNLSELFRQNLIETLVENKQLWSWASGEGISSHYVKLQNYLNRDIQMLNMAVSGSVAVDVLNQAKVFAAAMTEAPNTEVAYATIMIGANDACNDLSQETSANLDAAFDVLAHIPQKNKMKILVSSIPQVYELGKRGIKKHLTGTLFLSCEFIRSKTLKFCNRLTHWSDDNDYQNHIQEVQNMNALLAQSAAKAQINYPNLDVRFSDALSKEHLKFNDLAADCFHPNIKGQQQLSDILWNDQPWFQ